jgi:hypothetical protein
MVWLFSHKGSVEIYEDYLNDKFEDVYEMFITKFRIKDQEEKVQLNYYIKNMANVFFSHSNQNLESVNEKTDYEEETVTTAIKIPMDNMNLMNTVNTNSPKYNCCNNNKDIYELSNDYPHDEQGCASCGIFSDINFNQNNTKNLFTFKESYNENSFEKDDLGKMFNNSYDNDNMFNDE